MVSHCLVRHGLLAGLLFALPFSLPAQQGVSSGATPAPTAAADARLISFPVVIHDRKGNLISNLTKADLVLQVDDKTQTIASFDKDVKLPLTLGLLFDTSPSERSVFDEQRTASSAFLDQMITSPSDQGFVVEFARQVELIQEVTGSRPKLQAALKDLDPPTQDDRSSNSNAGNSDPNNPGGAQPLPSKTLYDATFLSADELMARQKGRKVLILLTDGIDRGSKENLTKALDAAQRADTVIYVLYYKGDNARNDNRPRNIGRNGGYPGGGYPGGGYPGGGYPGGGYPGGGYPGGGYPGGGYPGGGYPGGGYPGNPGGNNGGQLPPSTPRTDGRRVLQQMADDTGGHLFELTRKQNASQIFAQIADELQATYRLTYNAPASISDGYHRIELELVTPENKKDMSVQTREGFYTGK